MLGSWNEVTWRRFGKEYNSSEPSTLCKTCRVHTHTTPSSFPQKMSFHIFNLISFTPYHILSQVISKSSAESTTVRQTRKGKTPALSLLGSKLLCSRVRGPFPLSHILWYNGGPSSGLEVSHSLSPVSVSLSGRGRPARNYEGKIKHRHSRHTRAPMDPGWYVRSCVELTRERMKTEVKRKRELRGIESRRQLEMPVVTFSCGLHTLIHHHSTPLCLLARQRED